MSEGRVSTITKPSGRRASDAGRSRLADLTRPIARDQRIAKRRRPAIVAALVALLVAAAIGAALFGLPVRTWFGQDDQIRQLDGELAQLEAVNADLQDEVDRLLTDAGTAEAAPRDPRPRRGWRGPPDRGWTAGPADRPARRLALRRGGADHRSPCRSTVTRRNVLVLSVVAVAGAACNGQSDELSREAQVYAATIREVVRHQPPPPDDPEALPVVYVVAVGETTIAADVQAEVASEFRDEAEVQFADERDEAVDEDVADSPVLDDGVLIAVGDLSPDADPVSMEVEVYRSERDVSKAVFNFAPGSSTWSVTTSSLLPES